MRTIAIEEHFLASGFRAAMQRNVSQPGDGLNPTLSMTSERLARLADLARLWLQEMDASRIDLQVLSENGTVSLQHLGGRG